MTTDLGACEWFVYELRRSNLIDRGQLDQVIDGFLRTHPRAEPAALAEYLVQQNVLTQFQAERVINNKAQGLVLGPYTLVDTLGTGSMGTVYKAVNKSDGQNYAVKVLPRRSMWNVRLARRQVRSFTQFQHPSVVPFTDVGTSGGMHYLVWPLAEGETLEAIVQREGPIRPDAVALYGLQIAHGLAACHQNSIFHGLLKPSNIMIGTDQQARILDLGIGALLVENDAGESLVDTMSTANTLTSGLDCSSPESIMEPTNRTPTGDQYSLGCVMYYALTGRYPFPDGSAVEKMMAHQFKQPTSIRELAPNTPDGVVEVVEQLMQKSPDARYSSADDVVDALQPQAAEMASLGKRKSTPAMKPVVAAPAPKPLIKPPEPGGSRPLQPPVPVPPLRATAPPAPAAPTGSPRPSQYHPSATPPGSYPGMPAPYTNAAPSAAPPPVQPPAQPLPSRQAFQHESNTGYAMPPGYVEEPAPNAGGGGGALGIVTLVAVGLVVAGGVYTYLTYFYKH